MTNDRKKLDVAPITTSVLYHANCADGVGAAYACWLVFMEQAQYLPVQYGEPCPDILPNHDIYIVDFSYDKATIEALATSRVDNARVVVLDHHASAERNLAPLVHDIAQGKHPNLTVMFDKEQSGATLTWAYLHEPGGEVPPFFQYIRDRDLWLWQMPESRVVSLAFWVAYQRIKDQPERLFHDIHIFARQLNHGETFWRIVEQGRAMEALAQMTVKQQIERASQAPLLEYTVPTVNATCFISEVGEALLLQYPDAPFVAIYFDRTDGKRQWSLRGHNVVDVSVVAAHFGGGGHRNAAGFTTERSGSMTAS